MVFDFLVDLLSDAVDSVGNLIGGISDVGMDFDSLSEFAESLGTTAVELSSAALALGAIYAFTVLTADTLEKFIQSRRIKSEVEDILNNDPTTIRRLDEEHLRNAPKCSISDMRKRVEKMQKTSDGQTVLTLRVTHPISQVYTDVKLAAKECRGVYEGMTL